MSKHEPQLSPAQLGYRMPAEWEPHAATWLTWPRPEGISFPDKYDTVPPVYAELICNLVPYEEVHINVWNAEKEAWVRDLLRKEKTPMERVFFHHFPAYEPWCRDHGPIFIVRNGPQAQDWSADSLSAREPKFDTRGQAVPAPMRSRAIVDWGYNAWGNKYPPYDLDDAIPQHIARYRDLPLFSPGIVMEGGSIEVNGQGALLTTEACLLNPNRNPSLTKQQIEQHLGDFLGVTNIIWLGEGIAGDDTDGHIDDMTRFVDPNTIVSAVEPDPADANHEPLQANLDRLRGLGTFKIVELPMPRHIEYKDQRLPASYANFYIANQVVLVPTYRDPNDARAIDILQKCFPTRRVIGIDSTELIWGLGSFHCITQQEPA